MKMRIILLACAVIYLAKAADDLPSCIRAKCVHCQVEFIAKMCPTACARCGGNYGQTPAASTNYNYYYQQQQQALPQAQIQVQQPSQLIHNTQQTYSVSSQAQQSYLQASPLPVAQPPRQLGTRTLTQNAPALPTQAQIPQPRPAAAVPQYTQPQAALSYPVVGLPQPPAPAPTLAPAFPQYPQPNYQAAQPQTQLSTLAPLIEMPKASDYTNLANQPADLAQPLPEYGKTQVAQPTYTQPSAYNPFNTNPFNLPGLGGQGSSAAYNPFNPFQNLFPQSNGINPLDPFNLFNLGRNNQATATSTGLGTQVIADGNKNANNGSCEPEQTTQTTQANTSQYSQLAAYGQQQPYAQQNTYNYQTNSYQNPYVQTQQPQQQQLPVNNQQPQQTAYAQQTQQRPVYQVAQTVQQPQPSQYAQQPRPLPVAQASVQPVAKPQASIDAAPIHVQKYIDSGKPSAGAAAVAHVEQQCPRQPGWQPCISKELANSRFANCCARLGEGCAPLCNYDADLSVMQLAVLTGRCPIGKVADVMICASGYQDATPCCQAYNVIEPGYEICSAYCNPSAGLPNGTLAEKYKCLVKLRTIQNCFYVTQKP